MDPTLAYPFTVISIFGVINAFNMLDGMDGLLAALVILTLSLFHLFTATQPGFVSLTIPHLSVPFWFPTLTSPHSYRKPFWAMQGVNYLGLWWYAYRLQPQHRWGNQTN